MLPRPDFPPGPGWAHSSGANPHEGRRRTSVVVLLSWAVSGVRLLICTVMSGRPIRRSRSCGPAGDVHRRDLAASTSLTSASDGVAGATAGTPAPAGLLREM